MQGCDPIPGATAPSFRSIRWRTFSLFSREHRKASIRAKVEHPFRVIKRQFGLMKVRFRGLQKNTAHVLTLFALSNLWMVRKQLMAMQGSVHPNTA
jgi:transposase, IS5 family